MLFGFGSGRIMEVLLILPLSEEAPIKYLSEILVTPGRGCAELVLPLICSNTLWEESGLTRRSEYCT